MSSSCRVLPINLSLDPLKWMYGRVLEREYESSMSSCPLLPIFEIIGKIEMVSLLGCAMSM